MPLGYNQVTPAALQFAQQRPRDISKSTLSGVLKWTKTGSVLARKLREL
jgi:hypothetical protein